MQFGNYFIPKTYRSVIRTLSRDYYYVIALTKKLANLIQMEAVQPAGNPDMACYVIFIRMQLMKSILAYDEVIAL